jgi:hypothetical protein
VSDLYAQKFPYYLSAKLTTKSYQGGSLIGAGKAHAGGPRDLNWSMAQAIHRVFLAVGLLITTCSLTATRVCSVLHAQTQSPPSVLKILDSLNIKLEALQERYRTNDDLLAQLRQTSLEVRELRSVVTLSGESPQPERYLNNLSSYSGLMQRLIDRPLPSQEMLKVLREVNADFHTKVIYSKSSRGQPLREVEAIINTVKAGKGEVSGYEVWYVPRGLADYPEEYKRFDNLSTPAIMLLPPGNYFLWATRDNVVCERRPVTLGDDGRSKRYYDLPVK